MAVPGPRDVMHDPSMTTRSSLALHDELCMHM